MARTVEKANFQMFRNDFCKVYCDGHAWTCRNDNCKIKKMTMRTKGDFRIRDVLELKSIETEQWRVVEVVRCEDCRYWENRFDVMVCNLTDGMKGASDYCSYGERREDDN